MLTHVDERYQPQMVDIAHKESSKREALATGTVFVGEQIMRELSNGEIKTKKGPVFTTAIIAATMAVKKCHELIPFCHPLMIEKIKVEILPIDNQKIRINCLVGCSGKTGVEMEALMGVHIAALTIHDMCKAMSSDITTEDIHLLEKTGGKKDFIKVKG